MKTRQSGFTLIELVIVIVILGVLAATALPKFTDLAGEARKAKLDAAVGAVKSAAAIAHAMSLAQNVSEGPITMEDQSINLVNFYPEAASGGIIAAAGLTTADGYSYDAGGTSAGSVITINISGAPTPASCDFTYTAPTASAGDPPNYGTPDKSGC